MKILCKISVKIQTQYGSSYFQDTKSIYYIDQIYYGDDSSFLQNYNINIF